MDRSYRFSVVRLPAHPLRGERLNLALAVFKTRSLDIRPARRFEKLKAISAAIDINLVRETVGRLGELDEFVRSCGVTDPDARSVQLQSLSAFEFSPTGEFFASTNDAYEAQIANLLGRLIEPEPAPVPHMRKRPTKLLYSVKSAFKAEGVLARKGEGLEAHRIVPNHEIAEGLTADLLLQNGEMHVIETVDASVDEVSLRKLVSNVAVSALVFEQARMIFGPQETRTRLVYQASSQAERALLPSLQVAEHQGADLVNWESADDQKRFITGVSSLAVPLEKARASHLQNVHASTQRRFSLN